MNQNLFAFAWKETIRSAAWGKSLATNIGLGFLAVYFCLNFLILGITVPKILGELYPDADPISKFNSFVLGYLALELIFRQLMQKLPTVSFKPLLVLNIRRKEIANYMLLRSVFTIFNLLPLFLIVPVAVMMVSEACPPGATISWLLALLILILTNHFLSIYLKWRFNEAEYGFFILLGALAGLFALDYFGWVDFSVALGKLLDLVLAYPALALALIILPILFYLINFRFLISRMFIGMLSKSKTVERISDYSWLNRLGETGRFIALELKLIWRNKRPRSVVMMTIIMFAYGLLIYRGEPGEELPEFVFILGGIILVGMFSISYGQFFPAWHSNYFTMLMCQRLTMKQFLQSFYMLVTVVSVTCYFITLPYALMHTKVIYTHLSMLLYNLGVNIPLMFFMGLYSKKRLDLNQSSVMNYQGVGASQWVAGIPMFLIPIGLFYLLKFLLGTTEAYAGLGILGVVGIAFHSVIINYFSKQYRQKKHELINNYKNS